MKKPFAIAFSDTHFHEWPNFGQTIDRLTQYSIMFSRLDKLARKYKVNTLLFSGDLIHNNSQISNKTFEELIKIFSWFTQKYTIYAISGNHDQAELSTDKNYPTNWVNSLSIIFENLKCMDYKKIRIGTFIIQGIPYVNDPDTFIKVMDEFKIDNPKKSILLMHQTLPGSIDTNGFKLESSFKRDIFDKLAKYGLVLNGHIHKPHEHAKNILTVGATHQQTLSDMGSRLGCWLIFDDLSYKFISLGMPKFIYGESDGKTLGINKPKEIETMEEPEIKEFHIANSSTVLIENYLKKKKITSPAKKRILAKYLR